MIPPGILLKRDQVFFCEICSTSQNTRYIDQLCSYENTSIMSLPFEFLENFSLQKHEHTEF